MRYRGAIDELDAQGFTIPELIIVMTVSVFLSILVFGFTIDFWGSTATLQSDSQTFVSRQDAGDNFREALNSSSGLINQNSIADAHTNNPDPSDMSGTFWLTLHALPGNTVMPSNNATIPLFYYRAPSINTSKNFIMNGVQPYQDEFVLYLNGSTKQILERTLTNPYATGNRLLTSCPKAVATASCPADKIMASDVTSIDTRYFSRSGNPIDYTSITDPLTGTYIGPDFPSVEVIELTIHLYNRSTIHGATATSNETIIRIALRND